MDEEDLVRGRPDRQPPRLRRPSSRPGSEQGGGQAGPWRPFRQFAPGRPGEQGLGMARSNHRAWTARARHAPSGSGRGRLGDRPGPSRPVPQPPPTAGRTARSSRSSSASGSTASQPVPGTRSGRTRRRSPRRTWPVMNPRSSGLSKTSRRSASTSASITRGVSTPDVSRPDVGCGRASWPRQTHPRRPVRCAGGSPCSATRRTAISPAKGTSIANIRNATSSHLSWGLETLQELLSLRQTVRGQTG